MTAPRKVVARTLYVVRALQRVYLSLHHSTSVVVIVVIGCSSHSQSLQLCGPLEPPIDPQRPIVLLS